MSDSDYSHIRAAFRVLDSDNNGTLSADEMRAILSRGPQPMLTPEEVDEVIARFDKGGNDVLSIPEFVQACFSLDDDEAEALEKKVAEAQLSAATSVTAGAGSAAAGDAGAEDNPEDNDLDESYGPGGANYDENFGGRIFKRMRDDKGGEPKWYYRALKPQFDRYDLMFAKKWRKPDGTRSNTPYSEYRWESMSSVIKSTWYDDMVMAMGKVEQQKDAEWEASADADLWRREKMDGSDFRGGVDDGKDDDKDDKDDE
jgi:hypothetical protein